MAQNMKDALWADEDDSFGLDATAHESAPKTFWNSLLGLLLRWLTFLPAGFILYWIFIILAVYLMIAFTGDSWRWFTIAVFVGIIPFGLSASFWIGMMCSSLACIICPKPFVGGIIYATIVSLETLGILIRLYIDPINSGVANTTIILVLILGGIGSCVMVGALNDK